ncbi:MAG: hypothetical protein ABI835_11405 [Chloroflexota bacterium]
MNPLLIGADFGRNCAFWQGLEGLAGLQGSSPTPTPAARLGGLAGLGGNAESTLVVKATPAG